MPAAAYDDDQVTQVVDLVRRDRFLSKAAVKAQLRGRKDRRSAAIARAIESGQVWEGPGYFTSRGGALRSGVGLHPAPVAVLSDHAMTGDELGAEREAAGVNQSLLARRLGVSRTLIGRWETGRQRIPGWAPARIREALAAGPEAEPSRRDLAAEAMPAVLAAIETEPGITMTRLKGRAGHGAGTVRALEQALAADVVHQGPRGGSGLRSGVGYYPGQAPPAVEPPSPAELREARSWAGWSQGVLAARAGVSVPTLGVWEQGRRAIPAWAAPALRELVDEAYASPRLDRAAAALPEVLALVEGAPGISRSEVVSRLPGRRLVRGAITLGLESGELYGRRGLYRGPRPPAITAHELRAARRRAGWSLDRVASRLSIGPGSVLDWEQRGPVPEGRTQQVRSVLEQAESDADARKAAIYNRVATHPGISHQALTRGSFDRRQSTALLLAELVAEGRIYERSGFVTNARGVRRAVIGFWLNSDAGAGAVPLLQATEIGEARRRAGWSARELARRMGVSRTQVSHWETGRQAVPAARALELRSLFASAPAAAQPYEDAVRLADDELEALALAFVQANPGQPRRQVTLALRGDVRRRWAAVERLVERGMVVERATTHVDASGRSRRRAGLHSA